MEITNKTKTYAQDGRSYILTNDPDVTFENMSDGDSQGCIVNFDEKMISPELPIKVLARFSGGWNTPDRQIKPEEIKDFRQSK